MTRSTAETRSASMEESRDAGGRRDTELVKLVLIAAALFIAAPISFSASCIVQASRLPAIVNVIAAWALSPQPVPEFAQFPVLCAGSSM
jgi:hypothetical protein